MARFPIAQPTYYWHLEVSSKCALRCPRCPRTEQPGRYKVTELSLETIQRVFTPTFIRQQMHKLLLCGGQGDPIYNTQFLEIVRHFKEAHPELTISITTNGSYKPAEFWRSLRAILNEFDEVTFSVDGWDQASNRLYREGSDYASILRGIREMAGGPARLLWTTIVFRFNQDRLDEIREIARANGIDEFTLTLSSLFGSKVPSYIDRLLGHDPLEPDAEFTSKLLRAQRLKDNLSGRRRQAPHYRRSFHETHAQVSAQAGYVFPLCRAGDRGLYVDAEGILYPCSWVSHPFGERSSRLRPGKRIRSDESFWKVHRDKFDIHARSIHEILADPVWELLERGWTDAGKTFVECEQKCLNTGCQTLADLAPKPVGAIL